MYGAARGVPVALIIDSDQHLFETRTTWLDHIDPAMRDDALRLEDDDAGHTWLTWRDRRLGPADVQDPGETDAIGERQRRRRAGEPPVVPYDEALPRDYWEPSARAAKLADLGVDEAMLFPNYGLGWERRLDSWSRPALLANMGAWNRWCASVVADGEGKLHPVAHVSLADLDWLEAQLRDAGAAGVRTAMVAPALVDGRPLSDAAHDRAWAAFVEHGVSPVFHVADQPRPFDDAWYTDGDLAGPPILESVFLWTPPALAATDLIMNGVFDRHPDLRVGIVELGAIWVPMFLLMLDGGTRFVNRLYGEPRTAFAGVPSEAFREHVRVSSFSYEIPERIIRNVGHDVFMCCSDYPHSEGTRTPIDDYRRTSRSGDVPDGFPGFFSGNAQFLLRR
jgi:predicted TIM-barrel fold metal-dependent hydrolase